MINRGIVTVSIHTLEYFICNTKVRNITIRLVLNRTKQFVWVNLSI